jgi:N-acetylmuramoyl-L-alanine amidase
MNFVVSVPWLVSGLFICAVLLAPSKADAISGSVALETEPSPFNQNGLPASTAYSQSQWVSYNAIATIQSVILSPDGSQLVITANQPVTYDTSWDGASSNYRITISGVSLPAQAPLDFVAPGTPVSSLQLRQAAPNTVTVWLRPTSGVWVSDVSQPDSNVITLQLRYPGQNVANLATTPPGLPTGHSNPLPSVPIAQTGTVVVIDPGHGGPDPGAIGINGLREVNVILPISLEVAALLQQQGIQVVMTRQDDRDLSLESRVQTAERADADLFISIHANAISLNRPDVNGLETFYSSSRSQALAQSIQDSMLQATGMNNRGVKQARFYVIRHTSMPSVLVEVGFVTGAQDAPRLADPAFRSVLAEAIAQGILRHVQRGL